MAASQILRQMSEQRRHCSAVTGSGAPETSGNEGQAPQLPIAEPGKKLRYPQVQNPAADPWTPTRELRKRNFLPRRMGHLMQVLEKEQVEQAAKQKNHPDFRAGDVLELKLAVPDNKGRPGSFKGICIARRNRGIRTSFTLRNHLGVAGGVERSFPLHCPTIQSITVLERRKVRRAKLYYLRGRNPKEYRVN